MFDITVIGGGVIGCSIARELSKYKLKICLLEKECDVACGTTKANSAIVHAGYDAKPGTMKAKMNVSGNQMFDKLSKELDFPFKRTGSLVACFSMEEIEILNRLLKQGEENGIEGLRIVYKDELRDMEPNLSENVAAALYAPTAGIVCPYEMTIALAENAVENGVEFKLNTLVMDIKKSTGGFEIKTSEGKIMTKMVINAAGIFADNINNMVSKNIIEIIPRKGEYCLFDKSLGGIISRTVFQIPTRMGKGVLVTPTVDGNLLVGPTALNILDKEDVNTTNDGLEYALNMGKRSIRELPMDKIISSFAGLRAHPVNNDFIIGEAEDVDGFINAAGIESPGLSAAPAIAKVIEDIVVNKLKPMVKEDYNPIRKGIPKFREMSNEEREILIKNNPAYGRIVCRCELITEGEVIDSIRRTLGATTLDGVKRRTRSGMGRCQGGFCSSRIVDILARELNIPITEVTKFGRESKLLTNKNKDGIE